jgi:ferrous iron transport protein A
VGDRLLALGFTKGTRVVVLQNSGFGPVIVEVRDSRIALGRGEASRIMVEKLS